MTAVTAEAIRDAAEVLQINDRASLNEIRLRYVELLKKWHPDVSENDAASSHEMTLLLNRSYRLLVDYCTNYRFSFRLDEVVREMEKSPSAYWMERFGEDPIWS
jgi:preprotein translocase subunit Sec63